MSNAFDADYGTEQGRIESSTAPLGSYLFQLGSSVPGKVYRFTDAGSSYVNITQTADVTGLTFLKCSMDLRGVTVIPTDAYWEIWFLVDGTPQASAYILGPGDRRLTDMGVNLTGLTGNHDIGFQINLGNLPVGGDDCELPGVGVDALVEVDTDLLLYNRDPAPSDTNVPLATPIVFRIESSAGTVDLNRTRVIVNGDAAYTNGTIGSLWFTNSTITNWALGNGYKFSMALPDPWASESVITVEVFSALVGGPPDQLHETWTFRTEDVEAPVIEEAFATTQFDLRVTYSDDVTQDDTGASALDPTNYQITLVSGEPAVTPHVESVSAISGTTVLVHFDRAMTRNAVYRVEVTNVTDTASNVIAAPENKAAFVGYACPTPEERDFTYLDMLPKIAVDLDDTEGRGDLRKFSSVLQEAIDLLLCEIDRWPNILDPDTAPEVWLDSILADLGNPFTFELTATDKRRLAQILVDIYRSKGTGPGIVNAIRLFLGIEVTLNVPGWSPLGLGDAAIGESWILGSSDEEILLTFQIRVTDLLSAEQQQRLLAIVDYMSDAREFFILLQPDQPPVEPDHWSLGFSNLGFTTLLHA